MRLPDPLRADGHPGQIRRSPRGPLLPTGELALIRPPGQVEPTEDPFADHNRESEERCHRNMRRGEADRRRVRAHVRQAQLLALQHQRDQPYRPGRCGSTATWPDVMP